MPAAVSSAALTKRFGRASGVAAVDAVDLDVPAGSVYGFLGPNGSGKTTTIRMLLGLIFPTSGEHELLGVPSSASGADRAGALGRIGALIEGPAFHPYLSARENLARLDAADRDAPARTSRSRVAGSLERVGLSAAADKRYRIYSLGMRQRLGIAAALLRPRDLLILDEPTNGLDPQGTREVRALVGDLARDGVTVFLSSHLLGEVEQVCTQVGVLRAGRLVWQGPLAELRTGLTPRVRIETADLAGAAQALDDFGLDDIRPGTEAVTAALGGAEPDSVVAALVRAGVRVRAFTVEVASLEDQFVALTGEGFDVAG